MKDHLREIELAKYLLSVPGLGIVTVAGILGEIGDISVYDHDRQLEKLAGLNLVEESSGEKKGKRRISKRGRATLRSLLYKASLIMVAKNKEFKALYRHLRERSQNPLTGTEAIVAICRKLLRLIFALLKKETYYDPHKALGEYRLAQLQQAA